jgi:hypothetical protein
LQTLGSVSHGEQKISHRILVNVFIIWQQKLEMILKKDCNWLKTGHSKKRQKTYFITKKAFLDILFLPVKKKALKFS